LYTIRPPYLLRKYYPQMIWRASFLNKTLYLTFDDGPIPEVTPWVLQQLKEYNAKATFFCVGKNVLQYPDIYQQVLEEGHVVGNHTFNHLNGWKTDTMDYLENIGECSRFVKSSLFRPPYGKVKKTQLRFIESQYKVIMWDVLSGDFDQSISPQKCLENVLEYSREGSIIVFHDSLKAFKNLSYTLPKVLEIYAKQGYRFSALPS
jgi:peptidoglycan-N-acetylglucosamine deacetylase